MRIIFAGRDNAFNRGVVHWLKENNEVVACLFLEPDRFSNRARWKRIRNRAKRFGFLKAFDELAFHAYDRLFLRKGEKALFERYFPEQFIYPKPLNVPEYNVRNIHSDDWVAKIKEMDADIMFSVCGTVIFKPKVYELPRLGTFVLHEGLTPEYKGLHTPLWALMQGEPEFLGYTLLQVDRSIDGGKVLVQGVYSPPKDCGVRQWSFIAHHAIINGLNEMNESLLKLEEHRSFKPVEFGERIRCASTYTWMGLTNFLRNFRRRYRPNSTLID